MIALSTQDGVQICIRTANTDISSFWFLPPGRLLRFDARNPRSHRGIYCNQRRKKEGKAPQEDKLTLACFNSGDVPELIGRLSVALSHATHKIISLPMFRKDLGVSLQIVCCVWGFLLWLGYNFGSSIGDFGATDEVDVRGGKRAAGRCASRDMRHARYARSMGGRAWRGAPVGAPS